MTVSTGTTSTFTFGEEEGGIVVVMFMAIERTSFQCRLVQNVS
jgi:hypothetical protein